MSSTVGAHPVLDRISGSNRFLVQQVFKAIGNEYRISAPAEGTDEAEPLLFVKQKKLKIKEDIRFRTSPDADEHVFMIKAKTVFEFRGRHDVLDASGEKIGMIEKVFGKSLIRSHWRVRDPNGDELFESRESSLLVALLRRFFAPDWAKAFIPFNFVLLRNGDEAATYKRVLGKLRDRYVLEVGPQLQDVDRRLILAFAVALDALQDR